MIGFLFRNLPMPPIPRPKAHALMAWLLAMAVFAAAPERARSAPDLQGAKQKELEDVRQSMTQAQRRKKALESERAALAKEAEGITTRLVEMAARIQSLETLLDENERRIGELKSRKAALQALLRMNRRAIAELLAGLQKLRRDPPPPFVTAPDDVLLAVRGSMLLSAAVPVVDARAARLLSSLRRLELVRGKLQAEQKEKRRLIAHLEQSRAGMKELLARKRRLLEAADVRLRAEARRLEALADKARTLGELIAALRKEEKRRKEAERMRAEEERKRLEAQKKAAEKAGKPAPEKPPRPAMQKPRVAFTSLKGRLPWPAQGRKLLGFGEKMGLDSRSQGIYVSTRPAASVIAPADARVEVARPFRSYGELLILDAGQGYRILLAGLHETSVRAGDFVRAGEPVGEMGSSPAPATVTSSRMDKTRPILYMELRKNGRPVDATSWWLGARQEANRK